MPKYPWSQFFFSDYLVDTRCLTLEERGAWMDCLCYMWIQPEMGILDKTLEWYAMIFSVSSDRAAEILNEIDSKGVGDLDRNDDRCIMKCRRMIRTSIDLAEDEIRKLDQAERKRRYRNQRSEDKLGTNAGQTQDICRTDDGQTEDKLGTNAGQTQDRRWTNLDKRGTSTGQRKKKSSPLNNPPLKEKENQQSTINIYAQKPAPKGKYSPEFERFWDCYPQKRDKQQAWKEFRNIEFNSELTLDVLIASVEAHKRTKEWNDPETTIIYACRYLKNRRWEDVLEDKKPTSMQKLHRKPWLK